jgi:DNA polymerase elongation subunit (family B)
MINQIIQTMYSITDLKEMLFIDIETCSAAKDLKGFIDIIGPNGEEHWTRKAKYVRKDSEEYSMKSDSELYPLNAALYPEFGKVLVISIGQITYPDGVTPVSKIKSFYGDDEKEILKEFMGTMIKIFQVKPNIKIVGHNIKGFDIPYLLKRSIINGISIPNQLQLQKLKPWENCLMDTYDLWKFGGWNGASLSLICDLLNIPSPKDAMKAGDVSESYYKGMLSEIKEYCEGDVVATMNVMLKLAGMEIITKEEVPF